jgi:hypothetical protein
MVAEPSRERRPIPWAWFAAGAVAAVAVGYLAAAMNRTGWTPVGVVSLGVGLVLGLMLSALAAMCGTVGGKQLVVGAAVLSLVTVAATHAWLYRDFCRQWHVARAESPQLAIFRPEAPWSPSEYFAHELSPSRAVLWCVDAVLVVAAAVGTVAMWRRQTTKRRVAGVEPKASPQNPSNPDL